MSLLVRAALLGGLAYVVSRAVRKADGSNFLNRSDVDRISGDRNQDLDNVWPTADEPSTRSV